jgi:excisionase family DNA binding protein
MTVIFRNRGRAMEDRLLYRVPEVAVFLNIGRSKVYELLGSGDLPSVKIDRTRLVRGSDLRQYVDTSQRAKCLQDLLPNSSADQGWLLRGGDWESSAGYDISVRDGSARRSGQLWGKSLTCANTTYPKGVHPEGVQRR